MPRPIPNTTVTSTAYTDALTFAGNDIFEWGYVTVANNPVFAQLLQGQRGQADPQDEQYLPPATYPIVSDPARPIAGIRFRAVSAAVPLPQVFGNLYYPKDPGIQAGTPFTGVVSASGAVGFGVGVLNRDTSLIDVVSTNVETDLYNFSVPAGMQIDSMLRLFMHGDMLYNNGADTLRWRLYFGGVLLYDDTMPAGSLNANRGPWRFEESISNLGALNSQMMTAIAWSWDPFGPAAAPAVGIGDAVLRGIDQPTQLYAGISAPSAINTGVAQVLRVSVQWSAASVNNSFRKRYAILESL